MILKKWIRKVHSKIENSIISKQDTHSYILLSKTSNFPYFFKKINMRVLQEYIKAQIHLFVPLPLSPNKANDCPRKETIEFSPPKNTKNILHFHHFHSPVQSRETLLHRTIEYVAWTRSTQGHNSQSWELQKKSYRWTKQMAPKKTITSINTSQKKH